MDGRSSDDDPDDAGTFPHGDVPGVDGTSEDDAASDAGDEWGGDADDETEEMDGVFGPHDEPRSIEPGDPSFEHALFVLLGVLTGVASMLAVLGLV